MRKDDLILVIDMQVVYTRGKPWACRDTEGAAGNICRILDAEGHGDVIFTEFIAPQNPVGTWKDYNRINREINESAELNMLVPELRKYAGEFPVYEKSTYSSLTVEDIRRAADKAGRVVLTGVVSECCVLATAMHAIDLGYPVVYIRDAVSGLNRDEERAAELVLEGLDYVQTDLMTTDEYLEAGK